MNKTMTMTCKVAVFALMAGGAGTAFAGGRHNGGGVVVTDVAATVTQYNYDAKAAVTGLLVGNTIDGTTSLLTFPRVCGGIGAIAAPGAAVTYTGKLTNALNPVSLVKVTAFTPSLVLDQTTTVPYLETSGTVDRLNYDALGEPNGFFFLATGSVEPPVLVITGTDGFDLGIVIAPGELLSVTGSTEVSSCGPAPLIVVDATHLNGLRISSNCGHNDHDSHGH